MLQNIRERAQSWFASIIIAVLALAFTFWGIERYFTGTNTTKTVAKIGGYAVSEQEYNQAYQRLLRQFELQVGSNLNLTQQIEATLKKQALDQIIHNHILAQAALSQGYRITPDQLDNVLTSIPMFQERGRFSAERFQAVLNQLMYSEDSFLDQLRSDMLVNQMQIGLISSAFVLPPEITTAYALLNQKRDINYFVLSTADIAKNIEVTHIEQKNYYDTHQKEFINPEAVSLEYIELNLNDIINQVKLSDAEIKQYYEDNKTNFTSPASWQLAQILVKLSPSASAADIKAAEKKLAKINNQLKAHARFEKIANDYSDDIATAKKGGLLPWTTADMLDPAVSQTINNLTTGNVTQPIRTKYGYIIVKLMGYKPRTLQPFENVSGQVKKLLTEERAQKIFADNSDQLSNLTFSDSNSLSTAAKTLHLKIETTDLFTRKGTKEGLTKDPKIIAAAFSNSTLVQGYNSDPIQLEPGRIIVLRVKDHKPAALKPLKEVEQQVTAKIKFLKAQDNAQKQGDDIIKQITNGKSIRQLASTYGFKILTASNLTRDNKTTDQKIVNATFSLPKPNQQHPYPATGVFLPKGDYSVIVLTKVVSGNSETLPTAEVTTFQKQLAKTIGQIDYSLYAEQQIKQAKVKVENLSLKSEQ